MWCLVNKEKDRIISIGGGDGFAVGFDTKNPLNRSPEGRQASRLEVMLVFFCFSFSTSPPAPDTLLIP